MSFLSFIDCGASESGKTKRWAIQTAEGFNLGWVSWYGPWRKYTAQFLQGASFDPTCLREIADFIESKTREHKEK